MIKIFNDLNKKVENFTSINRKVSFYSCGPTVYNFVHIGNLRTMTYEDLFLRLLKVKGYDVTHVRNITDVEDKIIKSVKEGKLNLYEFTNYYTEKFFEDTQKLRFLKSDFYPRATDYISQMVDFILSLIDLGYAYKSSDGSVYFDISKFSSYGKLSSIDVSNLKLNASLRIKDEYDKDSASDFALWKSYTDDDGLVFWDTKLGRGRPGWHIECSVMASSILGETIDIHSGGEDLEFPHHENEIAQSEARSGKQFVRYWIHAKHLLVDGKKMSKSLGNFYTLRDLEDKGYDPLALKYLFFTAHYRNQLNFTFDGINASKKVKDDINSLVNKLTNYYTINDVDYNLDELEVKYKEFLDLLENDLDMPNALVKFLDFVSMTNSYLSLGLISKKDSKKILKLFKRFDELLGIMDFDCEVDEKYFNMAKDRYTLKENKEFMESDRIRDELKDLGYLINDVKNGFTIIKLCI